MENGIKLRYKSTEIDCERMMELAVTGVAVVVEVLTRSKSATLTCYHVKWRTIALGAACPLNSSDTAFLPFAFRARERGGADSDSSANYNNESSNNSNEPSNNSTTVTEAPSNCPKLAKRTKKQVKIARPTHVARESRRKARERARERTSQKRRLESEPITLFAQTVLTKHGSSNDVPIYDLGGLGDEGENEVGDNSLVYTTTPWNPSTLFHQCSSYTATVFELIIGDKLDNILNLLNFPLGTLPVRYLGVPLAAQRLNVNHYAPLYDRIASYINKWTANSFSYAGRLLLIKSVLQGVECFWLQIFPLPNTVIDRINRLCRVFLWGKNTSPIAWSKVCLPSDKGGLGLRDVHSWNKALLAKILLNIHSKTDSLWVRWVHSFYLKNQSIWTWDPKKSDSCLLKRICDIRNEILAKLGSPDLAISNLSLFSNSKGLCSSKMYDLFRDSGPKTFWHTAVWKNFIPPKFSFCVWLAINDRLATINNLKYLDVDPTCKLCGNYLENASHLFFDCIVTRLLWDKVKKWLKFSHSMSTIAGALKWTKKEHVVPALKKARAVAVCCTIYQIWMARNCQVFEGLNFAEDTVFLKIQKDVYKVVFNHFPVELVDF
ncbi:hypothetical protein DH2020_038662 [Rehmannia glutinosa]|uniref:R domain-containing protein n=1 Tax=Rehmannia glutinosa TaxID=99300 RepID=A0ABR0V0M1_REHGL